MLMFIYYNLLQHHFNFKEEGIASYDECKKNMNFLKKLALGTLSTFFTLFLTELTLKASR